MKTILLFFLLVSLFACSADKCNSPNKNGFDYSFVLPASLDFEPYVYVRNYEVVDTEFDSDLRTKFPHFWRKGIKPKSLESDQVLDDLLVEANGFIKRGSQTINPFFLYFPLTAPHMPVIPTEKFRGISGKGLYGDFICPGIDSQSQSHDPVSLHFQKDYQVRNFYNLSVSLSKLDLSQDVLNEASYPHLHLTSPGCDFKQKGQVLQISNNSGKDQQSYIKLGRLYNYAAIDMDIQKQSHKSCTASALLTLYKDEDNSFVITQGDIETGNQQITLEIFRNGASAFKQVLSEEGVEAPNTLRVHLAGKYLNVLFVKNEKWTVLGSFDVSEYFELRDLSLLESFSVLAGARLGSGESISVSKLEQYLTCGTAQADPKVLHYEDGAPIIEGNTIWVAMTTRAYDTQLYQGIYAYDLKTKEWELSGTMVFNKGDGLIRQWSASDVFYDRSDDKWKIFTVSHRDDHMLYSGESTVDPRFGLVEISCSKVNYASVGNEEDPSVIYDSDAGKWRMALCKARKGYQTVLMEADTWNGAWSQIAVYTPTSSTGILIQKIGGQRYVFIGRGASPCPMEVLSYPGMEKIGELSLSEHPVGKNVWPAIIPVTTDTGTAYYLLTFDRDAWTGQRTYGNIHWYHAEEFAEGFFEY